MLLDKLTRLSPQILFTRLAGFINRYYQHPAYQPLWKKLDGHAIQVNVDAFGSWILNILHGQLQITVVNDASTATHSPTSPTITCQGPLRAFFRLAGTQDLHQAQSLGLQITGDLSFALSLAQTFKNPPIDFTERLSGWIGDNAAVRLTQWGSKFYRRLKQGPQQIASMTTEYLQFEAELLPSPEEIDDWMAAVDILRDDVERLSARIDLNLSCLEKHAYAEQH